LNIPFKSLTAAALAIVGVAMLGTGRLTAAFSDTRSISFLHIHTKETLTVTYKKDGKYVPAAMDQIDWIMRDWRKNEKTKMDPHTIDILWEIHTELGSHEPINIICGYRSRATNEMLRKTVGGQASESQHITGKAIDVAFPDIKDLKQVRYAALVREQGGVGYYPTSGIPFVHVDTGRVRHWPRLPRYELALLFPNGSSQHHPADGGAITSADVKVAQAKHRDLATQIAGYFTLAKAGRDGTMVADAGSTQSAPVTVAAKLPPAFPPAAKPADQKLAFATASVSGPLVSGPSGSGPTIPKLVAEPKLIDRPSRLTPGPSDSDRSKLMELVTFASTTPGAPKLIQGPLPAVRRASSSPRADAMPDAAPAPRLAAAAIAGSPRLKWTQVASLEPDALASTGGSAGPVMSDIDRPGWGNGWATAPAFDEEHPEELSYRPFPLAPLLTASASIDEPVLSKMTAPDVARILAVLDAPGIVPPMSFRPGQQTAEVMWAQQFQGEQVQLADATPADGSEDVPTKLIPRTVKTTQE
jgi:uncharacterized protein YcbK (DUF882 family)